MNCPSCQTKLPEVARFCMSCGAAIDGGVSKRGAEIGERRHVTVVFTDLVGSTELSGRVDAEVFSDVVQAFHRAAATVMERHGGHVVKLLGDGLLVAFGYPQAHEDDAERAVRAAWDLPRAIDDLNRELGVDLAVRSGVHTGLVVVDSSEGDTPQLLGETINVAARLEGEADPNTVVITDATHGLVPGIFVTRDVGVRSLKGVAEPVRVHEVVQPSGVRSRLDVAVRLTPLVGREQEVGLLLDRWAGVEEGEGQVVLIGAEPGMGKSRLVRVFRERLADVTHSWLECRCSAYAQDTAFGPIVELLAQGLGFDTADTADEQLAALERGLVLAGLEEDTVLALASVLDLPADVGDLAPEQIHQRAVSALVRWTTNLGEHQPLVVAVEDLHWADPSSLQVLTGLVEQVPVSTVMVIATHRPEFDPPWPARAHVAHMTLGRLRHRQASEMVAALPGGPDLAEELVDQIVAKAGGTPLFVEELTKAVVETGVDPGADIPPTLRDSLMARLDRLPRGKEVAQVGAVIGREFDEGLLTDVATIGDEALRRGLDELVEAELLYRRGEPPAASYLFKHALVQDAAYESLLLRTRSQLHGRIAVALELRDAGPELLARHLEEAGRVDDAAKRWAEAARSSLARGAGREAESHARRGLAVLQAIESDGGLDALEWVLLDHALRATFETTGLGIGGTGELEDVRRYVDLTDRLGTDVERASARTFLASTIGSQGDLPAMEAVAREMLAMAGDNDTMRHLGHVMTCMAALFQAEYPTALEHGEKAAALPLAPAVERDELKTDFGVWLPWWRSTAELGIGRPDTALEIALPVPERSDPRLTFDRVCAWLVPTQIRLLRGEGAEALRLAEQAVRAVGEDDAPLASSFAHMYHGWCRARAGDPGGAEEAEHGLWLAGEYTTTTGIGSAILAAFVADAHLAAGRFADGLALCELSRELAELAGQPNGEPFRAWVSGECQLALEPEAPDRAEQTFRDGLATVEKQGAWYYGAALAASLAPILAASGRVDEGGDTLAAALERIEEGHGTPYLQHAHEVLASLDS